MRRTGRPGRARRARRARGGRPRRVPASEGKPSHDALDVLFHPAPQRRPLGVLDAATERKQHAVQRPARHHLQKSPGLARRRVLVRHRLEQHRQRNPMRRVLEPGRVKDERHVVRGRVAPNRRKVTCHDGARVREMAMREDKDGNEGGNEGESNKGTGTKLGDRAHRTTRSRPQNNTNNSNNSNNNSNTSDAPSPVC